MSPYDKKRERIFAVSMTGVSALALFRSCMYAPESSGFPRFLSGLLLLFSLILLGRSFLVRNEAGQDAPPPAAFRRAFGAPAFAVGSAVLYLAGIRYLGYFVSTLAFFLGVMALYGKNGMRTSLAASISFLAAVYGLFVYFLGMRLPEGVLF